MEDNPKPQSVYLIEARYYDFTNNRRRDIGFAVGASSDEALAAWKESVKKDYDSQRRQYLDAQVTPVSVPDHRITLDKIVE